MRLGRVVFIYSTASVSAIGTWGCEAASTANQFLEVRDSAGLQIVENLPGAVEAAPEWAVSDSPSFEAGSGVDPEVPLSRITSVVPLPSQQVAVGTTMPPHVLVLDEDGSIHSQIGQQGDGPGEFQTIGSVLLHGSDSLLVWDPHRRRASLFDLEGRLAREIDLSSVAPQSAASAADAASNSGYTHLYPLTSETMVLFGEGMIAGDRTPGVQRPELPTYGISSAGEVVASYGNFPGMAVVQPQGLPAPLGARSYLTTTEGTVVVGTAERFEYRMFDGTGSLTRIVRWNGEKREPLGAHLGQLDEMVENLGEMAAVVEALPRPESAPAHAELIGSDDGYVLVSEYPGPLGAFPLRRADDAPEALRPTIPVPPRRWWVFDPAGVLVATLTTPRGFEPQLLRNAHLWGVHSDDLGVESVRSYRLDRL